MKSSLLWRRLQQEDGRNLRCGLVVILWIGFAALHFLMDNKGASIGDWLYLNYLQGSGRDDWRWFLLRPVYTFGIILTLYATLGCMEKGIRNYGGTILLLKGSRIRFWFSECGYALVTITILVFFSALIFLLIFSIFGKASIKTTSVSAEYVRLWVNKEWSGCIPEALELMQETVLIPFLFSVLLSFLQLLLGLWRKTALSYLISVGLFLALPFFPVAHLDIEGDGIFDATRGRWVIVCLTISSICIALAGALKIRKADLLEREV